MGAGLTSLKILYNETLLKQVSFNQNLLHPSIINQAITSVYSADLALTHCSCLLKHFLCSVTLALRVCLINVYSLSLSLRSLCGWWCSVAVSAVMATAIS